MIIVLAALALGSGLLALLSFLIFPRWTPTKRIMLFAAAFAISASAFVGWVFFLAYSDTGTPVSQEEIRAAAEPTK